MEHTTAGSSGGDSVQGEFEYGPVELLLLSFRGQRPGPGVVSAILELIEQGTVNLLDLLFITRTDTGEVTVLEMEDVADDFGLVGIEAHEIGLASDEDIAEFAGHVAPGTSAALLVVELVWAKRFATALFAADGEVLRSERIPAAAVNEVLAGAPDNL